MGTTWEAVKVIQEKNHVAWINNSGNDRKYSDLEHILEVEPIGLVDSLDVGDEGTKN